MGAGYMWALSIRVYSVFAKCVTLCDPVYSGTVEVV